MLQLPSPSDGREARQAQRSPDDLVRDQFAHPGVILCSRIASGLNDRDAASHLRRLADRRAQRRGCNDGEPEFIASSDVWRHAHAGMRRVSTPTGRTTSAMSTSPLGRVRPPSGEHHRSLCPRPRAALFAASSVAHRVASTRPGTAMRPTISRTDPVEIPQIRAMSMTSCSPSQYASTFIMSRTSAVLALVLVLG
jgi:hypothetical protein